MIYQGAAEESLMTIPLCWIQMHLEYGAFV